MQPETAPHPPVNHVFVDLENVKTVDCSVVASKNLRLYLFLGPQNKKLDIAIVECLLEHSQTVHMIRSPKSGKNALDFVLAYHLGQTVLTDPKGFFHIVSKDTGFDALVELLKSRNNKVKRHDDWESLSMHASIKPPVSTPAAAPAAKAASAPKTPAAPAKPSLSTAAAKMLENLKKSPKNRPKKHKSLITHARNFSGKDKPDADAEELITELKKSKALEIDEKGNVSYLI
jgi:hypothetical protein